jgi:hypothetical protein
LHFHHTNIICRASNHPHYPSPWCI